MHMKRIQVFTCRFLSASPLSLDRRSTLRIVKRGVSMEVLWLGVKQGSATNVLIDEKC